MHDGYCYEPGTSRGCRVCQQASNGRATWGENPGKREV